MAEWEISALRKTHERAGFSCGKAALDSFLRLHLTQYEKRRIARTFVATEPGSNKVAGYYTLSGGTFDLSALPESVRKKLPKHPIPTIHLGRLAVDESFKGRRLGETLLFHALRTAVDISQKSGIFGVDLWAIDDDAVAFYRKYGFEELADDPHHLFLPMKTVEAMFAT
jgi:ribosomal protein S18 acetylase RimI-like enzyme